jgi:hypothetical protein
MGRPSAALGAAFLAAILGAAGCHSSVQVHAAQSPEADFEQYHTVAIDISPTAPDADGYSAEHPQSAEARSEIHDSAARVLAARGYKFADKDGADLVLRIEEGRRTRRVTVTRPAPATSTSPAELKSYRAQLEEVEKDLVEGAFAIDAFDARTHDLVWQGSARAEIQAGKVDHARLRRAVESVLRSFPPAPSAPAT